ncbi:MAG: prohibitin family protein [SAR324 cluster bacterium]|nr:prohibitin family protein [SAR324 cluster bacterium]|tara:strand:- start:268 stop:1152 length:885 start_codon:yes stop_codon:yes gene_type:complete
MKKLNISFGVIGVLLVLMFWFGSSMYQKVPAGYVGVATLFGEVKKEPFEEGLHVPVNPFYEWYFYDVRQKSHLEEANVPSQDQLQTKIQVSVQFRLQGENAPKILQETGQAQDVLIVHIVPKLRSLMREQGKTIRRAEDFFLEETQQNMQTSLLEGLKDYLGSKGVSVEAVLIRDISLPPFIIKAIESKKEREQEVEKQKAELERFTTEQQQKVELAKAESEAAKEQALKKRLLADAQAYEIEKINTAIGDNPNYVKLQALEALKAISKDPASKIYFMDGNSPSPLPLMNIGSK